jgi:hypothetical protein
MTTLPPLPEPYHGFYATPMYSPDQMRAYAREAIAAPQPLTDTQIDQITAEHWGRGLGAPYAAYRAYARAIEAAHGIVPAPTTDTKDQQ